MEEYVKRMIDELSELSGRLERLERFIQGADFKELGIEERNLMKGQLNSMRVYEYFLERRISLKTQYE